MEFAIGIAVVAIVCSGGVLALYARELRRITRFLQERSPESNARLALNAPLPGLNKLIVAIDEELSAERARERARLSSEEDFQAGLVGLSHDIRTPLAGAKGYLQLAADEGDACARAAHLEAASGRLDAMQELLDQLFAYTRSESASKRDARAGRGAAEQVDAAAILAEVLLGNLPIFERLGVELEVELGERPLVVAASEEDIRRIFDNAVGNMIKYGIAPFSLQRNDTTLVFSNGVADPDAIDIDQVFDRFYRADPARSDSGAGLGLAVVKNLCDAHDITVEARIESGSLFVLGLHFPSSGAM